MSPALLLAAALAGAEGPLIVMPPDGPAEARWVGTAVAELLPRALERVGVPAVARSERLRVQEDLGVPAASTTRATSIRLAESLGAPRLVVGSFTLAEGGLELSLRLIDVERASLSAPISASGPLEELARLVHGLAWDVALAGSRAPRGSREALLAAAAGVPFAALREHAQALLEPDPAERIAALRRVAASYAGYEEARLVLARLLVDAREYEEARAVLANIPRGSPFARPARFMDGVTLLGLGRHAEAAALFGALAAEEETAAALANRALARLRLAGDSPRASDLLRRAVALEPGAPDLPFNLGWALLVEGDAEAAAFWLGGVLRRDPDDPQARLLLSWALRRAGSETAAQREWETVAGGGSLDPALEEPDTSLRFERVQLSERTVVVDLEERSDAELAAGHAALGERHLLAGQLEPAVAELTRAVLLDPYSPRAHVLLGRAYLRRGERDKAVAELRMALWCREDSAVREELAALLREMGRDL